MGNSLGTRKTLYEELGQRKREVHHALRVVDRERVNLQNQEQQLIFEIKKMAKYGQTAAAKLMVKDLVRVSQQTTQFYTMRAQLQAVVLRMETARSTEATVLALQATTTALKSMAKTMSVLRLNKIVAAFANERRHQCSCDRLDPADQSSGQGDSEDTVWEALSVWEAVPVASSSPKGDHSKSVDDRR